ncbi:MAG: hypothetical protein LBP96_06275 [Bacteroidales bacterium]|jgi:hypothetical protein|nr:hypothetical protein [Bacteroidales bacterium]
MENDLIYVPRNKEAASNPYNVTVAALTSPYTFSGATILAVEVALEYMKTMINMTK